MSEDTWDSEDFQPPGLLGSTGDDRWEGEDEDDIPDDWMAVDEDSSSKQSTTTSEQSTVKKKKSLAERIAEKEAKRQEELQKRRQEEDDAQAQLTPEQQTAEKLRRRQLDEEADLELAKEMFGVSDSKQEADSSVLDRVPNTHAEFVEFREALVTRLLRPLESSGHYVSFVDELARELCCNMDSDDVKKITTTLNALCNEKIKNKQKQKKKKGAKLVMERSAVDDFDDFI